MRMNANHAHERVSHQIMRMTTDVDFENYAFNTSIMRNHFHAHEMTLSPQHYVLSINLRELMRDKTPLRSQVSFVATAVYFPSKAHPPTS